MSDQFQHVMVLTSIIIGLGITNALLGVSGAIERYTESDHPLQFSWASACATRLILARARGR